MSTNSYRLYGAPNIFPGEAISSWLQRLSQQQAISIENLFLLVGAKVPKDVDSVALSTALSRLIDMCGFNPSSFETVIAAGRSIQKTKPLQRQIRINKLRAPESAVCPECLNADRVPYYRIEWRLKFWKFCPAHMSPMVTTCGKCKQGIALNRDILLSFAPPPSLAYCQFCLSKLAHTTESAVVDSSNIKEKISVQRNMMAGILNGYCLIAPYDKKFTLQVMVRLNELGLLLSASRADFNNQFDPEQLLILAKVLNKLQVQIRSKERLHERASRSRRKLFKIRPQWLLVQGGRLYN